MRRVFSHLSTAVQLSIIIAGAAGGETNFSRINGFEPRFLPPVSTRICNVKTTYGAKGDGVTDDTKAFKDALAAGQMTIYIPAGTYIIKDQLRLRDGIKRTVIFGEQRTTTVLKLADSSPGFDNPAVPKAFLHTRAASQFGEQNFQNFVYHLTIEIGRGNPGAVGLNHHTNNSGEIKDICVRATDPVGNKGLRGIAFDDWWYGPGGGRYLEVEGFKTGIYVASAQNHTTIEHAEVRNCDIGLEIKYYPDTIFCVSARKIATTNCGLGVKNGGQLALVESNLAGTGASAIDNKGSLLCRGVQTSGFTKAIVSTSPSGDMAGLEIDHYSSHPVEYLWQPGSGYDRTMGLPVEESPEYQYPSSPAGWTLIGTTGDVGALVNAAIAGGATDVMITGGTISTTIALKGSVRRVMSPSARQILFRTASQPAFRLEDGTPAAVIVEMMYTDYSSTMSAMVEHASKRTMVFRYAAGAYKTAAAGAGAKVFVESVVGTFDFKGVTAWCRDINTEGTGVEVTSTNTVLWILGHRTESYATKIKTTGGGYTELLGGTYRQNFDFARQLSGGIDTANPPPLFLVDNSQGTFHFRNSDCYLRDKGYVFKWSVREIRGAETRNFVNTSHLCGATSLFAGYSQRPVAVGRSIDRKAVPSMGSASRSRATVAYDVQGRRLRLAGGAPVSRGAKLMVREGRLLVVNAMR